MDVLQYSGVSGYQDHRLDAQAETGEGLSMEELVSSMRNHLLNAESEDSFVYDRHDDATVRHSRKPKSRQGRHEDATCAADSDQDDQTNSRRFAGRVSGENHVKQEENMYTNGLTSEVHLDLPNSDAGEDEDSEIEIGDEYPRLSTPFYENLRQKYPAAFRRRSSVCSETSSICGMSPRAATSPRRPQTVSSPRGRTSPRPPASPRSKNSAPPRAPPRSKRGVNFDENSEIRQKNENDSLLSGSQRPPTAPRSKSSHSRTSKEPPQGILKKERSEGTSSNHRSSHILSNSHRHSSGSSSLQRSNSNSSILSLKERLQRNQSSLKELLDDENFPFRKAHGKEKHISRTKHTSERRTAQGHEKVESNGRHMHKKNYHNLEDFQSQISSSYAQLENKQKRSLVDNSDRKHIGAKRFASPDSPHDSAVDMDTASLQSSPSSDNQGNGNSVPVRSHRVKRHSRSPRTANGYSSDTPLYTSHMEYNKVTKHDSDGDSGIAQGYRNSRQERHNSTSSNEIEDDTDSSQMSRLQPGPKLADVDARELKAAQRQRRGASSQEKSGPMRGDHTIPAPNLPRQHNRSKHDGDKWRSHGTKPKGGKHQSQQQQRPKASPNSREAASNRVHFEDEIFDTYGIENQRSGAAYAADIPRVNGFSAGHWEESVEVGVDSEEESEMCEPEVMEYVPAMEELHIDIRDDFDDYDSELEQYGLSPGGPQHIGSHNLPQRQSRTATPNMGYQDPIEGSMEVHRASPIVILDPGNRSDTKLYANSQRHAQHSHSQNGYDRTMYADMNFDEPKKSKSKKPWKKKTGRYTPSEEVEKMQMQLNKTPVPPPRHSKKSKTSPSVESSARKPPTGKKLMARPASCTAEIDSSRQLDIPQWDPYEEPYEEIGSLGMIRPPSMFLDDASYEYDPVHVSPKIRNKSLSKPHKSPRAKSWSVNPYEVVSFHDENPYESVDSRPQPKPRGGSMVQADLHIPGHTQRSNGDTAVYAVVDKSKKTSSLVDIRDNPIVNNPCVTTDYDDEITSVDIPPVPKRGYISDLERHRELSGSRSSLSERMDSLKNSAKKKFAKIRKAVSLDRIDKAGMDDTSISEYSIGQPGKLKKTSSLRSLTDKLGITKKEKVTREISHPIINGKPPLPGQPASKKEGKPPKPPHNSRLTKSRKRSGSLTSLESVEKPQHFRPIGKLKKLNPDGSQVVELIKPPHGPFGFYIARGNASYNHGIFISRLSDSLPEKMFAGLLGLGDEILEINGISVRQLTLDAVYDLMAEKDRLLLKVLPFLARKDSEVC